MIKFSFLVSSYLTVLYSWKMLLLSIMKKMVFGLLKLYMLLINKCANKCLNEVLQLFHISNINTVTVLEILLSDFLTD